jgi:hypothetical protein
LPPSAIQPSNSARKASCGRPPLWVYPFKGADHRQRDCHAEKDN